MPIVDTTRRRPVGVSSVSDAQRLDLETLDD
jgi:hypothetical protein